MKITSNTLTLMRHSLGAVAIAAAVSADAYAGNPAAAGAILSDIPSATETTTHAGIVEQPEKSKKSEEEKKKDEQKKEEDRAPCPACGLG